MTHLEPKKNTDFLRSHQFGLLHDLFFTDYGLMSFIGLVFMLGMGVFFLRLFLSGAQTKY